MLNGVCISKTLATGSSRNSSPTSNASLLHVLASWQLSVGDLRMNQFGLGLYRWLQRYMHAVDQHHYQLQPDHGAGFCGIGGSINTKGIRNLDVCFEMAVGEIDSIELEDSDAPLLLSISDQRRLGLTVTLGEQDLLCLPQS